MGYYTGDGIVASGGSVPSSGGSFALPVIDGLGGARGFLKKITTTTVTKYPGVSLETAQESRGINNMIARGVWEQVGTKYFDVIFPDCSGNTTTYTFSQIGDSNLYELIKTYSEVTVTIDQTIQDL